MCSAHFLSSDIVHQSDRTTLVHGAVPSVFNEYVEVIDVDEISNPQTQCNCHIQANFLKLKNNEITNNLKKKNKKKDAEIAGFKRKLEKIEAEKQSIMQSNKVLQEKLMTYIPIKSGVSNFLDLSSRLAKTVTSYAFVDLIGRICFSVAPDEHF